MITKQTIEEYKNDVSKILNVPLEKISKIKEVSWLEKLEKGTKSKLYEVIVTLNKNKSTSLILKEYDLNALDLGGNNILKELITEKALLTTAKKYNLENIFPRILSENYEPFNHKNALLVETVSANTLEQLLSAKNFMNLPYSEILVRQNRAINNSLEISSRFYDIFPEHKERIEAEMKNLSNGKFDKIDQKNSAEYTKSFGGYLGGLFGFPEINKGKENFSSLIEEYWTDYADIIHDCYPFNMAPDTFIDLGNIKNGPIALQIGCLLGYPSVFDVLSSKKNDRTFFSSVSFFANRYNNNRHNHNNHTIKNPEQFAKGALVGAIYGNIRVAAGLKARHGEEYINNIMSLLYTSKSQAKMLGNEAKPIYDLLSADLDKEEINYQQLELF